ncbi:DUF6599 family protein [Humidesulfovibrio idahonensis]
MAGKKMVSPAQNAASLAVLALLCAVAAWVLTTRQQLNPAVEVALRAPALKAGQPAGSSANPAASGAENATEAGAPGAAKSGALASLLPESGPGLKPLAQAESFTPVTLSDKIDGKAELYLSAGFAAMACRSYQAGGARIEVYLYRMKSADAAFAVFSGQRRPGAAQSALAKNAYLTENALFLTSGAHYLEVIADRAGAKAPLEALAKAVLAGVGESPADARKTGGAAAQPQDLFPKAGLKADSVRLAVADAFGCQGLTSMYTAEYDAGPASAGGGATAFVSRRKTPAEAQATAQLYQRFLTDNGYAVAAQAGAPAGSVVLSMTGSVELLFVRGAFLLGVHDAADLSTALKLAAALDAELKAKGLEK